MQASTLPTSRKGFALLITITLLAFLVLLLVSLASLTRVETQVASNNQQLAQARQNALLALNIALGELQKYAGPDQRTTSRSDINATLVNTTTASGRWIGVYGGGAPADYTQIPSVISSGVVTASDTRGSQARLLNWLVSGNEATAFNPATQVGATGNIVTSPTGQLFLPTAAVSGLSASSTALTKTITIADTSNAAQPARLLVGPNTAGDSVADYVVAPLREISAVLPGMGSTEVPTGRYAWWVGDEGIKARANLPLAGSDTTLTAAATLNERKNAFTNASRPAVEFIEAIHSSANTTVTAADMLDPTGSSSRYNPSDTKLPTLFANEQLPLLSPANAAALTTVSKYRYHDISMWSRSVLSDTYAGGLKRDLSSILADTKPASVAHASPEGDTDFLFPFEPNNAAGGLNSNDFGVPTWGQLRSFAIKTSTVGGALTAEAPEMVTVSGRSTPTPTRPGVAPVMTYATIGFAYGVRISAPLVPDPTYPGHPLTQDNPGTPIRLGAFPVVVLWNPYTSDLQPAMFEVGFRKNGTANFELQTAPIGTTTWSASNVIETRTLDGYFGNTDPFIRFLVETPVIPAGQSLVFTLVSTDQEHQQGSYATRLTHGFRRLNHALLPAAATPATITNRRYNYRIGVNSTGTIWSGAPRTYFGSGGVLNFGNSDYSSAYFRLISPTLAPLPSLPPSVYPKTDQPYDLTNSASPALGVIQWLSNFRPIGQYGAAPYGYTSGYSRYVSPNGQATTALLRDESPISMISEPTFWLPFSMLFSDADTRWLVAGNPRAMFVNSPPPAANSALEPPNWVASPRNNNWPPGLNVIGSVSAPRASAGVSLNTASTTPVDVSLYEFRQADQPLLSIGQLQHANLSWLADNPAYPIGNSAGNRWLPTADKIIRQNPYSFTNGPGAKTTTIYDASWLINRALWDRYFVSTIPDVGTGITADTASTPIPDKLPNPRLARYGTPVRDATKAAGNLILEGGFNINSTSEQAWRAVLAGVNRVPYDPLTGSAPATELGASISRFSRPQSAQPATLDNTTVWKGYRALTTDQIAQLARSIVAEIRARGPSISLADFINRRLVDTGAFPQTNDKRLNGTLQAAIEATAALPNPVNSATAIPFTSLASGTNAFQTGSALSGVANATAPRSAKAAYAPQYLTQADVLSVIGGGLTARSDTFVIRTYGEALNAALGATDASYVSARAWCEAVVQRLPDFVDPTDATLVNGNATPPATTNAINKAFGRRYKIVAFRWLTPSDI